MHSCATGTNMCLSAAASLLLLLLPLVSTQCPADNDEDSWLPHRDACYKYYNQSEFWYTAEMACMEAGGHLVSIASDQENRLVGKLSLCREAWTGLYASDLSRMSDPAGYAWTDGTKGGAEYSRHNFTEKPSIHTPLIKSKGLSWYNSLYHERHPYVCKVPAAATGANAERKQECPSTMKLYHGHCYLLSSFESNFVEANFFCQNRSTQLTSVLHEGELRFLNTLDLGEDECQLQAIWLGLIKLNPCYPDRAGREMCYQWTDFSGKHTSFPSWADDQPQATASPSTSETVATTTSARDRDRESCVVISGDQMSSADCSTRHRFVCKALAGSLSSDAWKALDVPAGSMPAGSSESVGAAVAVKPEATATTTVAPTTTPEPTTTTMNSNENSQLTEATEIETTTAATQPPTPVAPSMVAAHRQEAPFDLDSWFTDTGLSERPRYKREISRANGDPENRFPRSLDRPQASQDSGEQAKKQQQQQQPTSNKQSAKTVSPEIAAALAAPKPTNAPREPYDPHSLEVESFLASK